MSAELGHQIVDLLLPKRMKLRVNHELVERLANAIVIASELGDHLGMRLRVVVEQVPFLTLDVRSETSIDCAKYVQNRRKVRAFDRIGQILEPFLDGPMIAPQ
jgi:hypothetical protein